jgi:hypothetical protein
MPGEEAVTRSEKRSITLFIAGFWLWMLTLCLGYMNGRASVMQHTVVRVGAPYYDGVFFGECIHIKGVQACATDDRDKKP